MFNSQRNQDNNSGDEPEKWYCRNCDEFRYLDGDEGYCCDYPLDCPSDRFGDQNCGHVVCSECHSPLSDRHLVDEEGFL